MNAYGRNGDGMKALEIYRVLSQPDEKSYSIILNACSHSLLIDQARQIFDSIPQQHRNVFVYATMVTCLLFFFIQLHRRISIRLTHFVVHHESMKLNKYSLNLNEFIRNIRRCISLY